MQIATALEQTKGLFANAQNAGVSGSKRIAYAFWLESHIAR